MGRCAQGAVSPVDFPSGSTTTDEAKITNPLSGANPLEDERHPWVKTLWGTFVIGRHVKTLGRHARPSHRLGGPSHAPPHAPEFTGKAVIVLTAFGQPGADAVLGTAHLDHPRQLGMIGRPPVEPIATEVDEPPALVLVRGIGLEHALRGVFRVRA